MCLIGALPKESACDKEKGVHSTSWVDKSCTESQSGGGQVEHPSTAQKCECYAHLEKRASIYAKADLVQEALHTSLALERLQLSGRFSGHSEQDLRGGEEKDGHTLSS